MQIGRQLLQTVSQFQDGVVAWANGEEPAYWTEYYEEEGYEEEGTPSPLHFSSCHFDFCSLFSILITKWSYIFHSRFRIYRSQDAVISLLTVFPLSCA